MQNTSSAHVCTSDAFEQSYIVTCGQQQRTIHATGPAAAIASAMALFGNTQRISARRAEA